MTKEKKIANFSDYNKLKEEYNFKAKEYYLNKVPIIKETELEKTYKDLFKPVIKPKEDEYIQPKFAETVNVCDVNLMDELDYIKNKINKFVEKENLKNLNKKYEEFENEFKSLNKEYLESQQQKANKYYVYNPVSLFTYIPIKSWNFEIRYSFNFLEQLYKLHPGLKRSSYFSKILDIKNLYINDTKFMITILNSKLLFLTDIIQKVVVKAILFESPINSFCYLQDGKNLIISIIKELENKEKMQEVFILNFIENKQKKLRIEELNKTYKNNQAIAEGRNLDKNNVHNDSNDNDISNEKIKNHSKKVNQIIDNLSYCCDSKNILFTFNDYVYEYDFIEEKVTNSFGSGVLKHNENRYLSKDQLPNICAFDVNVHSRIFSACFNNGEILIYDYINDSIIRKFDLNNEEDNAEDENDFKTVLKCKIIKIKENNFVIFTHKSDKESVTFSIYDIQKSQFIKIFNINGIPAGFEYLYDNKSLLIAMENGIIAFKNIENNLQKEIPSSKEGNIDLKYTGDGESFIITNKNSDFQIWSIKH